MIIASGVYYAEKKIRKQQKSVRILTGKKLTNKKSILLFVKYIETQD